MLNDNGQVSLPTGTPSAGGTKPAGELSAYTSRLLTSKPFKDFRDVAKQISSFLPGEIQEINAKATGARDDRLGVDLLDLSLIHI